MFHFVYKTTNLINNKYYIGVHSTDNIDDGYFGSGRALARAIKKYGTENFKREIIALFDERSLALIYEASIITPTIVEDINSYNLTLGGGCPPSQRSENLATNKLKGDLRTKAQKQASVNHSARMKGRKAHNSKQIEMFGQFFDSISQALKYYGMHHSHYRSWVQLT